MSLFATRAKVIDPARASSSAFTLLAKTDRIGRRGKLSYEYATELLTVDPAAPLEDDCLAVVTLGGRPFLVRLTFRHRDSRGRFVKAGSPDESFMTHFGWHFGRNDEVAHVLGRLVSVPRYFPRPLPNGEEGAR